MLFLGPELKLCLKLCNCKSVLKRVLNSKYFMLDWWNTSSDFNRLTPSYFSMTIPKIIFFSENVGRLKKLEYLNLALNNITRIENLEGERY